jgi:galacturonosyltransferase
MDNKRLFNDLYIHGNCELIIPGSGVNLQLNKLEKYPEDNGKIIFLFVARIMREKGIDILVKATSILRSEYKNIELHVVGPYEENYRDKIHTWEKDDLIVYHGEQQNIHLFMKKCHVLIHPSFYLEGMSNVCLEAAATGRPVITTNMVGCRDTVNDGKTGFICEPNNINSLVISIKKFLSLSYKERVNMGILGRKKMEREFDRSIVIQSYMHEIKKMKRK